MECFMKYLPFLLLTVTFYTQAAPVATPLNTVADLTEEQIQQTERQNQQKQAAQNGEKTSVSMTEEELLQRPDLLKNALDTANAQHNIENIRFLLPLYRRLPAEQQDSVLARYSEGLVWLADDKHEAAEKLFNEILAEHPDYAPVRLQLALSQSQNGKQREAANELKTLKQTPDLPAPVAQYIDQFDAHLQKSKAWQFNANAYYLQDSNVGRTPEQRTYGYWRFAEPKSAHGVGYELSAQKTTPIKGHWVARVNASAYGKFYWDAHDYDDLVTRLEAGPVWRDAKQEVSLLPFYEKRWYGGKAYSYTTGGLMRYSRVLSPKWQVFTAWQSGYKKHDKRTFLDGASHLGTVSLLYRTSPYQYFVVSWGGGENSAKDKSEAYRFGNLGLGWNRQWGSQHNLTTSLHGSVQKRQYRAEDFFNIKRNEKEYFTRLSLSHKKLAWRGFEPRLNWTWSHVDSNHFYYKYDNHRVFLDVSKQFK